MPSEADGQIKRVGERFALVAAAGELAIASGILAELVKAYKAQNEAFK